MLNLLRKSLQATLARFGMELRSKSLHEQADDPYNALFHLMPEQEALIIIDAGASIGQTSAKLAHLYPEATIHAIEPHLPFFEQVQSVANENPRIRPHKFALSNYDGTASLHINQSEGSNSLLPTSPQRQDPYGDLLNTTKEIEVTTQTLDTFLEHHGIERVDILKLDLQGSELPALKGASKALERGTIRAILCEVLFVESYEGQPNPSALLHHLSDFHSFIVFNLYQPHFHHGRLIQADVLLLHSDFLPLALEHASKSFHAHSNLPL